MYTKAIILAISAIASANALTLNEAYSSYMPEHCKAECQQWVDVVGGCVTNANASYSASVSTGDLASAQFSGDLSILSGCGCSAEAIQASQSCLACASEKLCISPALSMQDYSMVCQDPLSVGMGLLNAHKDKFGTCEGGFNAGAGSSSSSTEEPTSTAETTSSSSETSAAGGATTTPCPPKSRSGRYHSRR